eukprot:685373-Pyramimonas_sp.AAC.1
MCIRDSSSSSSSSCPSRLLWAGAPQVIYDTDDDNRLKALEIPIAGLNASSVEPLQGVPLKAPLRAGLGQRWIARGRPGTVSRSLQ